MGGSDADVEVVLQEEQAHERALDREYWQPLRAELQTLRHAQLKRDRTGRSD